MKSALYLVLPVALLGSAPLMAQTAKTSTANGPYVGIEGGVNWELPQDYRFDGVVIDRLHFDRSWSAGVIGGYSFSSGFRPELELNMRRNGLTHDTFGGRDSGHDNATAAMANLWYDIKVPNGFFSVFHPYFGGGVGAVRSWYGGSPRLGVFPIESDYATEFGYQAGAGLSYDITRNFTVSADWRRLWSDRGAFHDTFGVTTGPAIKQDYNAQTALLSVRYTFGKAPASAPAEPPPPPPPPPVAAAPPPPPPPPPPPCNPPAGFQVDANCNIIDQTLVVRAVDFEYNSARLTAPARQTLDNVAAALAKQPTLTVEVQGYTDSRGSDAYNLHLSQLRAEAVKTYLVSQGANGTTLTARGYGKANPIASNATPDGRAQNRRVAFEVTNPPAHVKVQTLDATPASVEAAEQGGEHSGNAPRQ
jgi:outer membrane protein OmpA-like peptidoglycan-associated protein